MYYYRYVFYPTSYAMRFIDQIRRIERLDQLIRLKATGKPAILAKRLGISESQLYEILSLMKKELGANIMYSKSLQSYYYLQNTKFICAFVEKEENKLKL
jgi:hypothetical protein